MITRLCAAIIGLLAFAGMILAGLAAENAFETIILRALVGMAGGMVVGFGAGYIAERVVYEHFRRMVDLDADAELLQIEAENNQESDQDAEKAIAAEKIDKEEDEKSRGQESPSRDDTFSLRAARQTLNEL